MHSVCFDADAADSVDAALISDICSLALSDPFESP